MFLKGKMFCAGHQRIALPGRQGHKTLMEQLQGGAKCPRGGPPWPRGGSRISVFDSLSSPDGAQRCWTAGHKDQGLSFIRFYPNPGTIKEMSPTLPAECLMCLLIVCMQCPPGSSRWGEEVWSGQQRGLENSKNCFLEVGTAFGVQIWG